MRVVTMNCHKVRREGNWIWRGGSGSWFQTPETRWYISKRANMWFSKRSRLVHLVVKQDILP